jgi:hypothetical protein
MLYTIPIGNEDCHHNFCPSLGSGNGDSQSVNQREKAPTGVFKPPQGLLQVVPSQHDIALIQLYSTAPRHAEMISRNHQTLTSVTLRSATSNPFTPSSHYILDLAFYIKTYTKIRTPLQQSALNTYFTSDLRSIYALGISSQFSDSEIVTAYFALFDKLFFFSSLKESCEVNLVERTGVGLNSYTIKSLSLPMEIYNPGSPSTSSPSWGNGR